MFFLRLETGGGSVGRENEVEEFFEPDETGDERRAYFFENAVGMVDFIIGLPVFGVAVFRCHNGDFAVARVIGIRTGIDD